MRRSVVVGILIFSALLLSGLGVGLYFVFRSENKSENRTGAVASTSKECTDAVVDILKKGGSAVDGAITGILCQGLTVPQSSGLGGGFIATIYTRETGTIETLNSREVAPLAATKDMYSNGASSSEGGLAIAVPTELKGLYELYKKYGLLEWKDLVQPVIEIAENGFEVSTYLGNVLASQGDKIRTRPIMR